MKAARARVDALDDAIVDLLAERAAIVAELWADKAVAGVPVRDPDREHAIILRVRARAAARGLDPEAVEEIARLWIGVDLRRG